MEKTFNFERNLSLGFKKRRTGFSFYFLQNDVGYARLAFSVKKRAIKKAVDRNTIKRIIRESFRHHRSVLEALDIVVIFYSYKPWNKISLRRELDQQWELLKLY